MKKNPIHFYWGRKNGLVVTREDAEGNHPEVVFVSNQLSLDKLNSMIRDIQGQVVTDSFNGIPLYLFSQICCSFCGKPLQWKDVCIANHQVFHLSLIHI